MNKSLLKLFGKYSLEENGWRKEQLFHNIEYSLLDVWNFQSTFVFKHPERDY